MLREFIEQHREQILAQAQSRFVARAGPLAAGTDSAHGLPLFLEQLREVLGRGTSLEPYDPDALQRSAGEHGDELFLQGASVAQLVHDYGDIGQVIRSLADAERALIPTDEARILGSCIDDAVAGAVTVYVRRRERASSDEGSRRLGAVAQEMRSELNDAIVSFASIRRRLSAPGGSTTAILDRSLARLNTLVDRSLAEVRLDLGKQNPQRVAVWEVIEEVEVAAAMIGRLRGVDFAVSSVDETMVVHADRHILASAVAGLLENAFKFTHPGRTVSLRASATARSVVIAIEDGCGGLSPEESVTLLESRVGASHEPGRSSLELPTCLRAMKAIGGDLRVHDVPGKGCVFTVELPKQSPAPTPIRPRRRKPGSTAIEVERKRGRAR
jgi:signal transduction histidine kinase